MPKREIKPENRAIRDQLKEQFNLDELRIIKSQITATINELEREERDKQDEEIMKELAELEAKTGRKFSMKNTRRTSRKKKTEV